MKEKTWKKIVIFEGDEDAHVELYADDKYIGSHTISKGNGTHAYSEVARELFNKAITKVYDMEEEEERAMLPKVGDIIKLTHEVTTVYEDYQIGEQFIVEYVHSNGEIVVESDNEGLVVIPYGYYEVFTDEVADEECEEKEEEGYEEEEEDDDLDEAEDFPDRLIEWLKSIQKDVPEFPSESTAKEVRDTNFKVGDKVRFRSWEDMKKEYGLDETGTIDCAFGFTEEMKPLCGTTATIWDVGGLDSHSVALTNFTAKGMNGLEWALAYSKDMIEKV